MKVKRSVWLGAIFLMATSAIGPGFLTQMSVFTSELQANFGFVILISILIGLFAQLNLWRIIAAAGRPAQDIGNMVFPGLGIVLSVLMVIGGLAFNIGNIAGTGLGINAVFGLPPKVGTAISAVIAISLFLMKNAGSAIDRAVQIAGLVMIALTSYVMFSSQPPVGEAIARTVWPQQWELVPFVALVGGTVGGYIPYAGSHRLLDAGIQGPDSIRSVCKAAIGGVAVLLVMRILMFLAVLGVVQDGTVLDAANPPASVFYLAAGSVGRTLFGLVMWAAGISSVIGAAYTSVSFLQSFHQLIRRHRSAIIVTFIAFSALIFILIGRPVKVLIFVGALNGLILPIGLAIMLIAAYRKKIVGTYRQPLWLTISGALVVLVMFYFGAETIIEQFGGAA